MIHKKAILFSLTACLLLSCSHSTSPSELSVRYEFVYDGPDHIVHLARVDGGQAEQVGAFSATMPRCSSSGEYLAAITVTVGPIRDSLILWNFKTQERRNLASIREGNVPAALDYAWSPDGTMIAFVHTETINQLENLFIVNIATGQIVQLTNEFVNHKPVWSADSKTISFVQYYNIANGTYDLYLIDSDGKNLRLAPFQVAGREPAQPTWNPDNKTVAFVGYKAPDGTGSVALDIYVTGVDGVTLQQLTTDGRSYAPEWSPDGKRIAFTISIFDGSLQCNLFIMNSDGTGKRALTTHNNVPIYGMHRWSADGKKIIYGYSPDINTPQSVHVMDVEDLSDKETVAKNVASYDWKPNN